MDRGWTGDGEERRGEVQLVYFMPVIYVWCIRMLRCSSELNNSSPLTLIYQSNLSTYSLNQSEQLIPDTAPG